jgi:hypothetical protein
METIMRSRGHLYDTKAHFVVRTTSLQRLVLWAFEWSHGRVSVFMTNHRAMHNKAFNVFVHSKI